MKISVVCRDKDPITKLLPKFGFRVDKKNPDLVIAFGGDGTFLYAEEKYPLIPKLLLYHGSKCKDCRHDFEKILTLIRKQKFSEAKTDRLELTFKGKKYYALNDVNIHYAPPCAMRFSLDIGKDSTGELIGDGVVISSPYGSAAYFNSITRSTFKKGIGIAFNNTTRPLLHIIAKETSLIKVKILRGPATLSYDCSKNVFKLKKGDYITVKKAKAPARLIKIKGAIKTKKY